MEEFHKLFEDSVKWFGDRYYKIELERLFRGDRASYGFVTEIRFTDDTMIFVAPGGRLSLTAWKIHLITDFDEFDFETELYRYKTWGCIEYVAKGVISDDEEFEDGEDVWSLTFYRTHQQCRRYSLKNK